MDDRHAPMDPAEAERRYGAMLEEAGLPRFAATHHDPAIDMLEFTWEHGLTIHVDLAREIDPIDEWERDAILGIPPWRRSVRPSTSTSPALRTTRARTRRSRAS
jgi:hypothetical protein